MKAYAVLFLAACVFGADARRGLRQADAQPTLGAAPVSEVRILAPASESALNAFSLQELTPSSEAMQESTSLMSALSSPDQFSMMVSQRLNTADGLAVLAASFSDLLSRGMSQQLTSAINQGFGQQQQPVAAQTGTSQMADPSQVYTAYGLAVLDQMSRGNIASAGEAIFWALNGSGGPDLAERIVATLDAFQATIGCSEPLRMTLANTGYWVDQASMGAIAPAAEMATGTTQPPSGQDMVSNVANWLSRSPSLAACFQSSYPSLVTILQQQVQQQQQQQGMVGAAAPTTETTTGTTGTTGTGTTGTTGTTTGTTGP